MCTLCLCVDSLKKRWNEEEVSDLITRLGFLDIDKKHSEQFLHINEVCVCCLPWGIVATIFYFNSSYYY